MLQHEQPVTPIVPSAAEARVTPEELNAALKALEDRQSGTVAIGSVVDELRLNATPEQIWEQVQQQRAQREQAAQTPPAQSFAVMPKTLPRRRIWWATITAIAFIFGGIVMINSSTHTSPSIVTHSSRTITISGDGQLETVSVKGKDVVVTGDGDNLTLHGQARSVTVSGDGNVLSGDAPKESSVTGDGNNVHWISEK